jgi:hypothetical protein
MVVLNNLKNPTKVHNLKFKRDFDFVTVDENDKPAKVKFQKDALLPVMIQRMTGRIFKPGKDEKGRFVDVVGVPDQRLMVFTGHTQFYGVFTESELNELFEEIQ